MRPERVTCSEAGVGVGSVCIVVVDGRVGSLVGTGEGVKVGSRVGVGRAACTFASMGVDGDEPQAIKIKVSSMARITLILSGELLPILSRPTCFTSNFFVRSVFLFIDPTPLPNLRSHSNPSHW